jgi:hypothetical protein
MADNPFWSFLSILRKQWLAAMSGAFSVPFTAAAVYFDNKYAQAIFACLAIASLLFAAYRIWKIEHDQVLALQEKLSPARLREIDVQEVHAMELRRHTDELETQRRTKQMDKIRERLLAPPRPINIVVGAGLPFEQTKATSTRSRERTFYLKVENRDQQKPPKKLQAGYYQRHANT